VAVSGGSQGGGISLAVAGLVPDLWACLPDVPFLCHYRRATEIVDTNPYAEISRYCMTHRDKVETVFNTLAYFDGVNFAARAQAGQCRRKSSPSVSRTCGFISISWCWRRIGTTSALSMCESDS
jgi:hypothetical protein